jgi:hypothetical protein
VELASALNRSDYIEVIGKGHELLHIDISQEVAENDSPIDWSSIDQALKRDQQAPSGQYIQIIGAGHQLEYIDLAEDDEKNGRPVVETVDDDVKTTQSPAPAASSDSVADSVKDASAEQAELDAAKKAYAIATKADDAAVPVHLWDQRALRLPPNTELPNTELDPCQERALNSLRQACLRFWKRKTVKDLCLYLSSTRHSKPPIDT